MESKRFWSLRKKILIGYGLALCLTIAVVVWSLINISRLGTAADAILKENYQSILAAENMIDALERQDGVILFYLLDYPRQDVRQFREYESHFLLWLSRAKDNITIPGEEQILQRIESAYTNYLAEFSSLQKDDRTQAMRFYHDTLLPIFDDVRHQCIQLRELNQSTMFKASRKAAEVSDRAFWSVFTLSLGAVALGLVFSLLLAGLIVRPVHQIIDASQKIAQGDYDVEVRSGAKDEIGVMAHDFNTMVKKLKAYRDLNVKRILSEKHKSEAVIRSIDDGLIVLGADLKIEDLNPSAARIFDKSPEEIKGRHLLEITTDEKLFDYVKKSFASRQSLAAGGRDVDTNILTVKKDSSQQHYLFSVTPVLASEEDVASMVLLLRDVTRLKELDRLKSEFVMAASHELKTPLTSIALSISLLKERLTGRLDSQQWQLLEAADEEVQRLKALLSDLLDISRIEAGKMPFDFDAVGADILFEKAVSVFRGQADEKKIELSYSVPSGLPRVKADINKITWVLTNLISNALRYTPTGGYIRLSARQAGPQVFVSVADNGAGIPHEYQSRIFDKFVRLKTEQVLGGSGLGLSICKEIVRAHGGTIWVDSQPGQGSTFTFTVPAAAES